MGVFLRDCFESAGKGFLVSAQIFLGVSSLCTVRASAESLSRKTRGFKAPPRIHLGGTCASLHDTIRDRVGRDDFTVLYAAQCWCSPLCSRTRCRAMLHWEEF